MPSSLNKVMVIGNVGRDPEMRYTPDGSAVTSFSMAATDHWTTKAGERNERTEWFNVVAWNKLAEICGEYVKKGMRVYVDGRLQTREWEASDGQKRSRVEVVASTMIMLSGKGEKAEKAQTEEVDDELPF